LGVEKFNAEEKTRVIIAATCVFVKKSDSLDFGESRVQPNFTELVKRGGCLYVTPRSIVENKVALSVSAVYVESVANDRVVERNFPSDGELLILSLPLFW